MGKSPKPLKILVHPDIASWGELDALRWQGHTVAQNASELLPSDADLILGPTCWQMTPKHRKYLKDAIAAARKRRYPKEKP